jgi:hypothetical protein
MSVLDAVGFYQRSAPRLRMPSRPLRSRQSPLDTLLFREWPGLFTVL